MAAFRDQARTRDGEVYVEEIRVVYESVMGVACSSARDEAIELDSFLGRWDSGWVSALALRRAARKSARRCREISLCSLMKNDPFTMGSQRGIGCRA
jgi:hypothetical protein